MATLDGDILQLLQLFVVSFLVFRSALAVAVAHFLRCVSSFSVPLDSTMPSPTATVTKTPKGDKVGEDAQKDFFWTYTEEPHRTRRLAIIKAHPEVGFSSQLIVF